MVYRWTGAGDEVDDTSLEPETMDRWSHIWCRWYIIEVGDNVDGTSLEPEMMSIVHHWSQARDDVNDSSLEPVMISMIHRWSRRQC